MVQPPSGTVTFLFTDIESSTRLWEERPDEMRAQVAEHDARFRAAIEANNGYVVKGTGDGVHAAFARAADAVAAAAQAQAAIADLPDIRARMGLYTGEAQERDGDYFGPVLNRAARLTAAGHGGQILLSAVTAGLVPDVEVRDLGEHRLRDLSSPMIVLQLGAEEFPPLRTLDKLPGNLPMQRTSFVGRADEVKQLATLVHTERMLTLTGVGGVGKSRLALQVAAEIAPDFAGGVWFVPLAALEEGALVAVTILDALGVPERRGEPALDTLCGWAAGRDALLVLDNCEHLLNAVAGVVDRIADVSSELTIVVTSQAPLGVRGERVWAVNPLSRTKGVAGDSVELFVDRAQSLRADFALTPDNEAAVIEICERLDHIPLAIELAAARVRGMTPADIASRLDQRFRLLASNDRLAPGRHRTLDAAVRWSYELLDDVQQRVFDRLSVFVGPFTIDAAEAVVAGDEVDAWNVLDALLALVDKSLVVADEDRATTRYRLLETMRHFGQTNLHAAGEQQRYTDRHADYYLELVLSRLPELHGAGDRHALDQVEGEFENVRIAMRYAADDESSTRHEQAFGALFMLWMGQRQAEGLSWAREIKKRTGTEASARIVALGYAACVAHNVDLGFGALLASEAIELAESTGAASPSMAGSVTGLNALMQGDNAGAVALAIRARERLTEETDEFIRANVLLHCVAIFATVGEIEQAKVVHRELDAATQRLGSESVRAMYMNGIAPIVHLTDPEGAADYLRQGYELNMTIGNNGAAPSTMMYLALFELRRGDLEAAADAARTALDRSIEYGPVFTAQVLNVIVPIIRRRSPADAAVLLGALDAHRTRRQQAGTQTEVEAEGRYAESLRRQLGAEFDTRVATGRALDEEQMLAFAFACLDAVSAT